MGKFILIFILVVVMVVEIRCIKERKLNLSNTFETEITKFIFLFTKLLSSYINHYPHFCCISVAKAKQFFKQSWGSIFLNSKQIFT